MKIHKKIRLLKIFAVSLTMLVTAGEGIAYAYLDPGSGSYIFQVLIAMLLGAIFTLKAYWQRLKIWLASILSKSSSDKDNQE